MREASRRFFRMKHRIYARLSADASANQWDTQTLTMNIVNLIREAVSGAGFNIDSAIPRKKSAQAGSYRRLSRIIALRRDRRDGVDGERGLDTVPLRSTHHGVNPNETILSPATVGGLTVKWRVSVGGGGDPSATVVGSRVYVVRERANDNEGGGKLYALDKETGQQLWNFPPDALAGDFSTTTPAVANGIVYFGVNRGGPVVYAVDAATGVRIWSHGGPLAQIISSPNVLDGRVYVTFTDGTIRALDAASGQIIWSIVHPGGAYSSPAIAGGRLYIAIHNQGLLALDANTGSELWLSPMPGPQWSSPAVDNGRVFVGSRDDHKVYAFDAVTGQTLWTATTSDWVHSSPAVANGVVYIGNEAGDLHAFNAATGGIIWRTGLTPTLASSTDRRWRTASFMPPGKMPKLYAVEAATGRVLFRGSIDTAGQSLASPTVDEGTVTCQPTTDPR